MVGAPCQNRCLDQIIQGSTNLSIRVAVFLRGFKNLLPGCRVESMHGIENDFHGSAQAWPRINHRFSIGWRLGWRHFTDCHFSFHALNIINQINYVNRVNLILAFFHKSSCCGDSTWSAKAKRRSLSSASKSLPAPTTSSGKSTPLKAVPTGRGSKIACNELTGWRRENCRLR